MSNVVLNGDFTLFTGTEWPDYWTSDTWEPLLSCGALVRNSAIAAPGVGYFVRGAGRNEIGMLPGLLYSGPGFDAGPGDTWQISFDYQWRNGDPEWQSFPPINSTNVHNVWFRYGITIWNPLTQHWDAWYADVPAQNIPLPADPRLQDGVAATYLQSFVVPANFPRARYQFAIVHGTNNFTQAQWESPTGGGAHRGFGYSMKINNVSLEKGATGGDGPGSAPADSFYAFWPTPRFAAGYPGMDTPPPRRLVPQDGFDVGIEWDQVALNGPMQIEKTTFPHTGANAVPTAPGLLGVEVLVQDGWPPSPNAWYGAVGPTDWALFGSGIPPEFFTSTPGAVPLPDLASSEFNSLDPITFQCGAHRALVSAFQYMVVGVQEQAGRNIFGTTVYGYQQLDTSRFWNPEARPGTPNPAYAYGGGFVLGLALADSLAKIDQELDYELSCQDISDVRVWQRYG